MTKAETAKLLTLIAAFDRRTLGEADVEAWHLILGDLDPTDCADAVKAHFTTSREWLMPTDVRTFAVNAARRREGQRRLAEREAEIAAENPPALEARDRPLAALLAGTPIKSAPRRTWTERRALVPGPSKPPFTDQELRAAQAELDQAAALSRVSRETE